MTRTLEEIQDDILDRVHAGETIDQDAVLAEHPEYADDLRGFFTVIALVEGSTDEAGLPPARLGEFRILGELGRGGMGVVYEAEQTSLKRRVALKVLPPLLRMDSRLLTRFKREAEAAGRLRHPGIVPVFAVGEAAGTPFFAMELVEGATLRDVLAARRKGQDERDDWQGWAVETVARVADALAYAHQEGILHRDVKPANILLGADGAPRLTDFGLAQDLRSPGLTQTGEVFGSPQYMSPEQAVRRESPVDERTDVYSLAVTLYEMLTLRLPYDGSTNAEVLTALAAGNVIAPRKVNPAISKALEGVLLRALRTKPQERYRNAAAFATDLRAALAGGPLASHPAMRARTRVRLLAAGAAVLLVGAGAWWLTSGDKSTATKEKDNRRAREALTLTRGEQAPDSSASVDEILAAYQLASPRKEADYRTAIQKLKAIDTNVAKLALKTVYEQFIRGPGKNDKEARSALGYLEFEHEVPEEIALRRYGYVRAVEQARKQRWFDPRHAKDEYALAQRAWNETEDHARRLVSDPKFRAMDRVVATFVNEKALQQHYFVVRYAEPYVICFLSKEPVTEYDAFDKPGPWRTEAILQAAERVKRVRGVLAEKARIGQQVHAEFVRRYGKKLGLKPLTSPYGGRPDYPATERSFADGCPLLVCVFESRRAFAEYHRKLQRSPISVAGYVSPRTGAMMLYDHKIEEPRQRAFEIRKCASDAVHQLEYWYTRQRNRWRKPRLSQDWFSAGWAEYLGAVQLHTDGRLRFKGVEPNRLENMQRLASMLKAQGKTYPVFPVDKLTGFTSFGQVQAWGASEWQLNPALVLALFYEQAWALAHFLNEGDGGAHRDRFDRFVELALSREPRDAAFRAAFGLWDAHADAWKPLNDAFEQHVRGHLMKLDASAYQYEPPPVGHP